MKCPRSYVNIVWNCVSFLRQLVRYEYKQSFERLSPHVFQVIRVFSVH
jgi:hypothetical protein